MRYGQAVQGLILCLVASLWMSCAIAGEPPRAPERPTTSPNPAQLVSVADAELHDPLVFVIYGDMRFTDSKETNAANPGARRALVEKVASEHPDALFVTGDVPWHGGSADDYQVFAQEAVVWQQQHLRVYPVLGNHEFSQCEQAHCLENWWQAFPQVQGWRWYSVALGTQIRAFALDSNASLLAGSQQRLWLQEELETLPDTVRFVIVTLHHPPVADQGLFIVRRNERALAKYLKTVASHSTAKFIVCSGHVHNYERFRRDGILYLVSGGGGAKPLHVHRGRGDLYQDAEFPNYHYIRFELQGDQLSAEMVRLEDYDNPTPQTWAIRDRFEVVARARSSVPARVSDRAPYDAGVTN